MWSGYDIFREAGLTTGKQLQTFVDATKEIYNKMDNSGFPFAPMQSNFSFTQLEKESNINAMATIVDLSTQGTPISHEPVALQTGNIPRFKKRAEFDEIDLRTWIENTAMIRATVSGKEAEEQVRKEARMTVADINKKLIDAHSNRVTYMRHQMVSTGKFVLTNDNNKGGIEGTLFEAQIPGGNIVTKTTTARWWTNATTEGSASNPIQDLKDIAQKVKLLGGSYVWEVDQPTFYRTLNHSVVIKAIGLMVNPTSSSDGITAQVAINLSEEAQKRALEQIIGFPIKIINSVSRVDAFDQKEKKVVGVEMRSFKPDVWALVPAGNIGETLSVRPLRLGGNESNYAEYHGGRLLMTMAADVMKKIQYIETEMTAIVVPNKPKQMYIINTVG